MPRTLPPCLRPDDLVAVVSPAGRPDPALLDAGVAMLESRGLRVRLGAHVLDRYGHLAGADRDRAADLMDAFLNPEVRAIFCARGGAGCARMLPCLDLAAIAARPKVFVGYSDVTVLHLVLARMAGWPTFYGPMVATEFGRGASDECFDGLWRLVSRAEPAGDLACGRPWPSEALIPGVAEGRLTGGTLCLATTSLGTPYAIRTRGRLLALEDVHEPPWRVDRMLTHLQQAGVLEGAAGFLIGQLTDVEDPEELARQIDVRQSMMDHLGLLGRPTLTGLPFGHIPDPLTLPFNCRARLDVGACTLTILEAAVADA